MLEESQLSIWASMHTWFTPTVLFIFINVVIGTILFSSTTRKQEDEKKKDPNTNPSPLFRTSSVLERLRSINLYRQNTQEIPPLTKALDPQTVETVETLEFQEPNHFSRSQSDTHPTDGERPEKLAQKIKKSASAKSAFGHFEEEEIVEAVPRPATTRERKMVGEDEEVDAKADDFINKFRQQLKLQRLDSIIKYREMLNRGK